MTKLDLDAISSRARTWGNWESFEALQLRNDVLTLALMVRELSSLCAEAYQVVGCLAGMAGVFDRPEVAHVLDNLAAAGDGNPLPHETLLPFHVPSAGPVMPGTPSDAALVAGRNAMIQCKNAYVEGGWSLYRAIRAALAKEQSSGGSR